MLPGCQDAVSRDSLTRVALKSTSAVAGGVKGGLGPCQRCKVWRGLGGYLSKVTALLKVLPVQGLAHEVV